MAALRSDGRSDGCAFLLNSPSRGASRGGGNSSKLGMLSLQEDLLRQITPMRRVLSPKLWPSLGHTAGFHKSSIIRSATPFLGSRQSNPDFSLAARRLDKVAGRA
ncbi:hypothetical protein EDB85DRAFT_2142450 [Lactarius pseudohatsudake]|nr:hypothetical protein EDB85DRAFT_2142450 [Lactarius pseudohatsudake]